MFQLFLKTVARSSADGAYWPRRTAAHLDGAAMETTVYERYGGFASVSRIVLDFYDRLLDDDALGAFFEDVDITRVVDHQTKFIAMLLGGPASYSDEQIGALHRHLPITDPHFDQLKRLLADTLADHGMAAADVDHVVAEFERRRALVVK
jgi:hemoglobin